MKQVILVPMWLNMSPGKVAAQCCHVTALEVEHRVFWRNARPLDVSGREPDCRIILKVTTKKEMAILWQKAERAVGISAYRFKDRAPTTEGTDGKFTAYSFVGEAEHVDALTGHLELY